MGVQNVHAFVKQRCQSSQKAAQQNINQYLANSQRNSQKIRIIIDGNNFAFTLLRESQCPGLSIVF